ncbi:MAG TPA: hypothetical protein VEI26_02810 [Terriglobales bacterium]|nr:hypothetical protein [Terriglobales bacterium]
MLGVPAAHHLMLSVAVEVISAPIMILADFLSIVPPAMVVAMVLLLGKCQVAAKREYGRDKDVQAGPQSHEASPVL